MKKTLFILLILFVSCQKDIKKEFESNLKVYYENKLSKIEDFNSIKKIEITKIDTVTDKELLENLYSFYITKSNEIEKTAETDSQILNLKNQAYALKKSMFGQNDPLTQIAFDEYNTQLKKIKNHIDSIDLYQKKIVKIKEITTDTVTFKYYRAFVNLDVESKYKTGESLKDIQVLFNENYNIIESENLIKEAEKLITK